MYPKAGWWSLRTTEPEYQLAYDRIIQMAPAARNVLDVGCGTGEMMVRMLQHGKADRITGIDISALLLNQAVMRLTETGIRLHSDERSAQPPRSGALVKGDYLKTPFPQQAFDGALLTFPAIVSSATELTRGTYEQVTSRLSHQLIEKVKGALRPDGWLLQVEYDAYPSETNPGSAARSLYSELARQHNMTLDQVRFYHDKAVAADVDMQSNHAHRGYVIALYNTIK